MQIVTINVVITYFLVLINARVSVCNQNTTNKNPKIIIIGAGAAGIAAASKLFQNDFKNVIILEAGDRIGGRIHTTKFGNYSVDLGAQWIHGQEGNRAYELANPLGVLDSSSESYFAISQEFLESSGNKVNDEISKNLINFNFNYILKSDFNDTYTSVGDYIEKIFSEEFKDNPEMIKEKKKYLHLLELFRISLDSAESWYDISASDNDAYKDLPGDQMVNWKTRGYSTILDILMKRYPDSKKELPVLENTILNSEVISVDYLTNDEVSPVFVTTAKGQLYKADHVIITFSLGVLKEKHKYFFLPPLPDYKVSTIEGLGFGNVAKVYLLFKKPFWNLRNKRILHFTFIWNDADRKKIENESQKQWVLGISGVMTVEHKPNLLELWIDGKYAREMELLPEDKILNHTVEILHQFLDKYYRVSKPIKILTTQWYSNPYFRGTYSFRSVESDKRKIYPEMLEKPLNRNLTILFAGEATSKERYSTVDGAIGSGWKAANRLIYHYRNLH